MFNSRFIPYATLTIIFAITLSAPVLSPYDPMQTNIASSLTPPTYKHILGTDLLGRDIFSRLIYGGRQSLVIATIATIIAVICGMVIGMVAAWNNKLLSYVAYGIIDALLAIPVIVVALVILTALGQGSWQIALATGIAYIGAFARMTQSSILGVRHANFMEGARAVGAQPSYILLVYVIPNVIPVLAKYSAIIFSYSLITSSALSFLGLSGEPGIPDWGAMLAEGRRVLTQAPWISIASGSILTVTVLCVNLLIDSFEH